MTKVIEGMLTATNEKFCIIVARFNEFIGSKLLSGAVDELVRHGVKEENIDIIWCPGAFEIPLVAKKAAKTGKYNAIITLGAVIKVQHHIMIMFAQKFQKVLHLLALKHLSQ